MNFEIVVRIWRQMGNDTRTRVPAIKSGFKVTVNAGSMAIINVETGDWRVRRTPILEKIIFRIFTVYLFFFFFNFIDLHSNLSNIPLKNSSPISKYFKFFFKTSTKWFYNFSTIFKIPISKYFQIFPPQNFLKPPSNYFRIFPKTYLNFKKMI